MASRRAVSIAVWAPGTTRVFRAGGQRPDRLASVLRPLSAAMGSLSGALGRVPLRGERRRSVCGLKAKRASLSGLPCRAPQLPRCGGRGPPSGAGTTWRGSDSREKKARLVGAALNPHQRRRVEETSENQEGKPAKCLRWKHYASSYWTGQVFFVHCAIFFSHRDLDRVL